MLTKFSVCNFKNFKNKVTLNFCEPQNYEFNQEIIKGGCVTKSIIIGINGSGKSNLGLALFDIVLHLTDKNKLFLKYNAYSNLDSKKGTVDFEYEFVFGKTKVLYRYSKKNIVDLVYESLVINGEEVVNYDYRDNTGFTTLKGAETLNLISPQNKISRVKYLKSNAILEANSTNKSFYDFMDFVDNMLLFYSLDERGYQGFSVGIDSYTQGIVRESKTKEFEDFLRENDINYNLIEKEVDGHKELYCHYNNGEVSFANIASTGTKSLALFYYWYIKFSKVSFVYIDEFDAFYHYELAESLVKLLKRLDNTQIVLTSHNTDLLSNDLLRPDCYFIIKNNEIKSFSESTSKDIRRAHNIQKMYKAGSFNE